jgi:hypothetical protein
MILLLSARHDWIAVFAATLFGTSGDRGKIGKKIFVVPITVSDLHEAGKKVLPSWGSVRRRHVIRPVHERVGQHMPEEARVNDNRANPDVRSPGVETSG